MMKRIKLYMLIVFVFCMHQIPASEQSKMRYKSNTIVPFDEHVNEIITTLPNIDQMFTLLQKQNLIDQSFRQFLQTRLVPDDIENEDEQDANFGEVLEQAQDLITKNMRSKFICTLDTAIEKFKKIDQFQDPVFMFVMQHKDDFMYDMVRDWLHEWSKIKDKYGQTSLHRAAWSDSPEIVRLLINAGANVNLKDNEGSTPLHATVSNNCYRMVSQLINAGADVNIKDNNGRTPLHKAVNNNCPGITQILLTARANLNIKNNKGQTPLHVAAYFNCLESASILITAGANINIKDNNGQTAKQRASIAEMRLLFEQAHINRHHDTACCIIS